MRFFYCLLLFTLSISATVVHAQLLVVTDSNHPVHNLPAHARVVELDAVQRLQEELSVNLSDDSLQAEIIIRRRLELAGPAFQEMMQAAMQGIVDAWAMRVIKIPAVIVDRQFVVYGEPDISHAAFLIDDYQEQLK